MRVGSSGRLSSRTASESCPPRMDTPGRVRRCSRRRRAAAAAVAARHVTRVRRIVADADGWLGSTPCRETPEATLSPAHAPTTHTIATHGYAGEVFAGGLAARVGSRRDALRGVV